MGLVEDKPLEDDSSSQWQRVGGVMVVEQSWNDPAPSRLTENSVLIPKLSIYEN